MIAALLSLSLAPPVGALQTPANETHSAASLERWHEERRVTGRLLAVQVTAIARRPAEAAPRMGFVTAFAAARLPEGSAVRTLQRARERAVATGLTSTDLEALRALADDLRFVPVDEAPRPEGHPPYTPVGAVALLELPAYRMARAGMRTPAEEEAAFWTLFQHIKRNEIAMTAPVRMDADRGASGWQMESMAFLYEAPDQDGATLAQERVVDVAPCLVLSTGLRGRADGPALDAARARIEDELARRTDLERDGGWRVLGWNSPFVPIARQFHELQLVVRPVTDPVSAEAGR